jgi:nickel transport protein
MKIHIRHAMPGIPAAALLAVLLFFGGPAQAHMVSVFAWVDAGKVHTESKFSGGRRVKGGKIEVFDHRDQIVHTGTTDEKGYYAFDIPAEAKELKIVLTAGMGHMNHWIVRADELGVAPDSGTPTATPSQPSATPAGDTGASPQTTGALDVQTMETVVERVLERKLAPIRSQMTQQSWGLRDIVAGLGYILGLMGLASYIHHRRHASGQNDT